MPEILAKIEDWDEKQHYKDRNPPWIKLHKSILQSRRFQTMQPESKALAPQLWLLASNRGGVVDLFPDELIFQLRWPWEEIRIGVIELIQKGYVIPDSDDWQSCYQLDSKSPAKRPAHAIPETETETETEAETDFALTGDSPNLGNSELSLPDPVEVAFKKYQEMAKRLDLPSPTKLTKGRRAKLKTRFSENGGPGIWDQVLREIEASPGLKGANDRGWQIDFDFLLQPSSLQKLLEGKYRNWGKDRANGKPADDEFKWAAVRGAFGEKDKPDGESDRDGEREDEGDLRLQKR